MRDEQCLYSRLCGTDHAVHNFNKYEVEDCLGAVAVRKIEADLQRARLPLGRIRPNRILLKSPSLAPHDEEIEGFWLPDHQVTVDHLVNLQASSKVQEWLSGLRKEGRDASHDIIADMARCDTNLRPLGALSLAVGEELMRSGVRRPDAPWNRDPERCSALLASIEGWVKEGLSRRLDKRFSFRPQALHCTPLIIPMTPSNDLEGDFLSWISNLIVYCLKQNRPVIVQQIQTHESGLLSELIAQSASQEAA